MSGRVLVTGATGCLGSHLARRLVADGATVRALVRPSSRTEGLERLGVAVQRGSLTDEEDLRRAVDGIDLIYHLGGLVIDDPSDTSQALWRQIEGVNVDGSERLARLAAAAGARRLVFCSSLRIFGFGNQVRWGEDDPRTPGDLYARGKALTEERLLAVGAETGLEIVNVRPRFIYGDGDRYVLPRLIQQVQRGRVPMVNGGRALCDIVYAEDCAEALVLAGSQPVAGRSFNITSGECLSLRDILVAVADALEQPIRFVPVPAPLAYGLATASELGSRALRRAPALSRAQLRWYMNDHHFSIARARLELGYQPRYLLPEALARIDLRQFAA